MGLEIYYPADIHNALLAAEHAVTVAAGSSGRQDNAFAAGFLVGYQAALTTLALAFGLVTWDKPPPQNENPPTLLNHATHYAQQH